jgi:hypothetical protein
MRKMVFAAALILSFQGVASEEAKTSEIPQEWKSTTLSDKTLATIQRAVESYHRCLDEETKKHVNDPEDSRKLTDQILMACDPKLIPIKPAFQAEKVPDTISERYLQRKRSQAAQQIVQVMMGAHALRYRETHP